ncbi:MAG: type II toxin-antitoxin system YafQ family toxin, partial [Christensenellales bacterium]
MSRTIKFTSQFKKDVKLMKKQGKNLDKLFDIVEK